MGSLRFKCKKSYFGKTLRTKEEIEAYSVFRDHAISVYTDESKLETGTDSGILSDDLDIVVSG